MEQLDASFDDLLNKSSSSLLQSTNSSSLSSRSATCGCLVARDQGSGGAL